jgi:pimeloyl-ACP methyl ester carboxylesterase
LDWFDGMTDDNVREYSSADHDRHILMKSLRLRADRTIRDPESMLEFLRDQVAEADLRVLDSAVFRRLLTQTYLEGLRHGPYGWIDDVLAFRADWDFSFDAISGRVLLWHGKDDTFSPINHTWWLARQIPGAEVEVQTDTAHFGAMEVLPRILARLIA